MHTYDAESKQLQQIAGKQSQQYCGPLAAVLKGEARLHLLRERFVTLVCATVGALPPATASGVPPPNLLV